VVSGDASGAAETFARACAAAPGDIAMATERARVLWHLGRFDEAAAVYQGALDAQPWNLDVGDELASMFLMQGRFDDAWEVYRRLDRHNTGNPNPMLRHIDAAVRVGEVQVGIAQARECVARFPEVPEAVLMLCVALAFEDTDPGEHLALHRRLGLLTARGVPPSADFPNLRQPNRPLRVAFLSTDFRYHACAFFMAALLSRIDREQFGVYCYALNAPDQVSHAFASLGVYRELRELSDDQIEQQARQDVIDVLVDCSGWSRGCRMGAVCRRLAPVQVNWLGYAMSTGVPTMDYRFVDEITDPPGSEAHASELLVRLGRCFVAFAVPEHTPPARLSPAMSALAREGREDVPLVFGCFNRPAKVQQRAMRAFARVLRETQNTRLLVKDDGTPGARTSFKRRFISAGGDPTRLAWSAFEQDPRQHLDAYCNVDVFLDPFPYNGTTTTCESLLMGVPVISLEGGVHRARVGASILRSAGLGDLVAGTEDEYVAKAVDLARRRATLLKLRQSVRECFLRSPVCDATGFARAFGNALRGVWARWCTR
jgi:protein O-GlcNAc transferase